MHAEKVMLSGWWREGARSSGVAGKTGSRGVGGLVARRSASRPSHVLSRVRERVAVGVARSSGHDSVGAIEGRKKKPPGRPGAEGGKECVHLLWRRIAGKWLIRVDACRHVVVARRVNPGSLRQPGAVGWEQPLAG